MLEKRVRLTAEFRVTFREITEETLREVYAGGVDLEREPNWLEEMRRQRLLLEALLRDEEALRQFIACAIVGEIVSCEGELLRKELCAGGEEEVLWRVAASLGGADAEYYAEVREEREFEERTELVIYSTPVECVGVRVTEVGEDEGAEESATLR